MLEPTKVIPRSPLALLMPAEAVVSSLMTFFSRPETVDVVQFIELRDGTQQSQKTTVHTPMPTVEEWCIENRTTKSALLRMADEFQEIHEALEFARAAMKVRLIHGGLDGSYDSKMVAFVASNETDMKVKSEVTTIPKAPQEILDQIEAGEIPLVKRRKIKSPSSP